MTFAYDPDIFNTILNTLCTVQVFAISVERKSDDMKKQKKKQEKLIMKMLPKAIIEKVMEGGATTVADTFDNATLYFSAVDGFIEVSRHCRYANILIHFASLTFLFFLDKIYS